MRKYCSKDKIDQKVMVKRIALEEQYFFTSIGGIFLLVFILVIVAILRLKFFL